MIIRWGRWGLVQFNLRTFPETIFLSIKQFVNYCSDRKDYLLNRLRLVHFSLSNYSQSVRNDIPDAITEEIFKGNN